MGYTSVKTEIKLVTKGTRTVVGLIAAAVLAESLRLKNKDWVQAGKAWGTASANLPLEWLEMSLPTEAADKLRWTNTSSSQEDDTKNRPTGRFYLQLLVVRRFNHSLRGSMGSRPLTPILYLLRCGMWVGPEGARRCTFRFALILLRCFLCFRCQRKKKFSRDAEVEIFHAS